MTKRWLVILGLVAMPVLAVPLGALSLTQGSPAGAPETVVPEYGAPAYVDGGPVGGGSGYARIYTAADADYVVDTAAELKSALASATSGDIVYVADGATVTLDSDSDMYGAVRGRMANPYVGFYVKAGVTLAGGRGGSGVTEGIIQLASDFHNSSSYDLVCCEAGGDVAGLTIEGPQDGISGGNCWVGIDAGANSEVYNNEICDFGYAGVGVYRVSNVWIHHNYLHHIRQNGYGYPIVLFSGDVYSTASAIVEGNIIDYARHFIAATHGRSSYIFRYNYLGANCTESQIDCHGQNDGYLEEDGGEYIYPAGENLEIYNNTSLCTDQPLVVIRGVSYSAGLISVHNNWSYLPANYIWKHQNDDGSRSALGPIAQCMDAMPDYGYSAPNEGDYVRMEAYDNWWGTASPPSSSINQPPVTPAAPEGTASGVTGNSYSYSVNTSDPDGDSLAYTIDWGDGTSSTTSQLKSGVTATTSHVWMQAGTYIVKVRATDSEGSDSAWSPALAVQIASTFNTNPVSDNPPTTPATLPGVISTNPVSDNPPAIPATLSGVISGSTSCTYSYNTVTTDPDGDALSYTFYWGDGTYMTVPQSNSGVRVCTAHAWDLPGTYFISVMATDSEGTASGWSGALAVTIVGSAPANATDTGGTAAGGDTTGSTKEQEGDSSVGQGNTAPDNANSGANSNAAPMSAGYESVRSLGGHGSGFVLCLLTVIVMVASAVLLVGAIVRESTLEPARECSYFGDTQDP